MTQTQAIEDKLKEDFEIIEILENKELNFIDRKPIKIKEEHLIGDLFPVELIQRKIKPIITLIPKIGKSSVKIVIETIDEVINKK